MPVKTILLISYYFAPQNAIGAVRPTKLAKYLTRMGYEVTVLCANLAGEALQAALPGTRAGSASSL